MQLVKEFKTYKLTDYTNYKCTFDFFEFINPQTIDQSLGVATTCTDYLTDYLMYPDKRAPIGTGKYKPVTTQTQVIVNFKSKTYTENFMKFGLPIVHMIEKINKCKRTRMYKVQENVYAVVGSKLWVNNTFNLSLYLKLFRNLCILTNKPNNIHQLKLYLTGGYDYNDLTDDLVLKTAFLGKLRQVNSRCKYKHGYSSENEGDHSNNGIKFTVFLTNWFLGIFKKVETWDPDYSHSAKLFTRAKRMAKIYNDTKEVKINEMSLV